MPKACRRLAEERPRTQKFRCDEEHRTTKPGEDRRPVTVRKLGIESMQQVELGVEGLVEKKVVRHDDGFGKELAQARDAVRSEVRAHEAQVRCAFGNLQLEVACSDTVGAEPVCTESARRL